MNTIQTGLERLFSEDLTKKYKGKVALLCHQASVDANFTHASLLFKKAFGDRFIKIFSPQHGFMGDLQDNMVESNHFIHPFFNIPVYSLYSETRIPTDEMLDGVDHLFVDLQDVGCRVYTYIYTLTLLLEKCAGRNIEIIVLDRPNPISNKVEGDLLDMNFSSFVGRHPLRFRHGMTIGEVGSKHQKEWAIEKANYQVISVKNHDPSKYLDEQKAFYPWVMPSPNLPTIDSAIAFPFSVFFEGTVMSEGRGTSRPLEIIGHPQIEPFQMQNDLENVLKYNHLEGVFFRPIYFQPTFQKHAKQTCGGFQLHVLDRDKYEPFRIAEVMLSFFYQKLGLGNRFWKLPPYEYEFEKMPIDLIFGRDFLRKDILV